MWFSGTLPAATLIAFAGIGSLSAQDASRVDFNRDVLPILRQSCFGCHGPSQQIGGLRLDRRSSVMKAIDRRVVPGSSTNSRLYSRLIGTEFGQQMPPTGPLREEQVAIIRNWIDQGAEWPDSLANEVDRPPVDPKVLSLVEMLRRGDDRTFLRTLAQNPKLVNARGPGGATPLLFAVLYGRAAMLERLIRMGANVNARTDANATALFPAVGEMEKTQVLLRHGAEVNVRSDDLRTPLMTAARQPGNQAVVRALLQHGANPNPNGRPATESSPLIEAATAGDTAVMKLLIDAGADVKGAAQPALAMSIANRCAACRDLLIARGADAQACTSALQETAVYIDPESLQILLNHGADVNERDSFARTPLMYAAGSDLLPTEVVRLLIEHGADVNAKDGHKHSVDEGFSVLDIARFRGKTGIVDLLEKAGAKASVDTRITPPRPRPDNSVGRAIARSIPAIQAADAGFTAKSGCISCHNDSLSEMAAGLARKAGLAVNETVAGRQIKANIELLERVRDRLYQGYFVQVEDNFGPDILGYMLIALEASQYKADLNTDAATMYIRSRQMSDGHWEGQKADTRPPLGSGYIEETVLAMRALQLYAPAPYSAEYTTAVRRAAKWVAAAEPGCQDDLDWKVIGLKWAGTEPGALDRATRRLLEAQHSDGGWSDIPSMESTPYATGKAVTALRMAGMSGGPVDRGVKFLLETQLEDGSWHVKSRSLAFQPYFESGFPHGYDQWISAAASSWSTMALVLSLPRSEVAEVRRR
jgi:ankyrin repeat protein